MVIEIATSDSLNVDNWRVDMWHLPAFVPSTGASEAAGLWQSKAILGNSESLSKNSEGKKLIEGTGEMAQSLIRSSSVCS